MRARWSTKECTRRVVMGSHELGTEGAVMQTLTRRDLIHHGGAVIGGLLAVPLIRVVPASAAAAMPASGFYVNAAHWGAFYADVSANASCW
jgi:hypothetical protein